MRTKIICGPARCQGCGVAVWWARRDGWPPAWWAAGATVPHTCRGPQEGK
jgi:hypothetical protein